MTELDTIIPSKVSFNFKQKKKLNDEKETQQISYY